MTNQVIWKDDNHFSHWPNSAANWMGTWNLETDRYDSLDLDNIQRSLAVAETFLERWGKHPAFGGYQPVNEPWWSSDFNMLKVFYRNAYSLTRKYAPEAYFVFHDGFRFDPDLWNDLFRDDEIDKVAIDHHQY